MKKKIFAVFGLLTLVTCSLTGCNKDTIKYYSLKKEIAPYIFETNTYTSLDDNFVHDYFKKEFYNWNEGGCSAITKQVDGHRLVGRNMDLNASDKCAYIVRTEIENKLKTFGICYTNRDSSDYYSVVKSKGLNETFYKILPYLCCDVINEAGLHIEVNMRNGEAYYNGMDKFACSGTNPNSDKEVMMLQMSQVIGLNCSSLEEVETFVKTLNIYSKKDYWNFAFVISDSNSSILLEFAENEIYFTHESDIPAINSKNYLKTSDLNENPKVKQMMMNEIGQTNFYVNERCNLLCEEPSGIGRFNTLQEGICSVNNKTDLLNLMKSINFSKVYDPNRWGDSIDARFELLGYPIPEELMAEFKNRFGPGCPKVITKDIVLGLKKSEIEYIVSWAFPDYPTMTREEIKKDGSYWESVICEVVDVTNKEINVRFFENDETMYKVTFDNIVKITSLDK